MKKPVFLAGIAGIALLTSFSFTAPALAATPRINDFEAEQVGATDISGWEEMIEIVDLGVTELGGCVSVDTSDYTLLRDFADYATDEGQPDADPMLRGDDVALDADWDSNDVDDTDSPYFSISVEDGATLPDAEDENEDPIDMTTTGKVVKLYSNMDTDGVEGYVLHGPALVSDEFYGVTGDQLSLSWAASGEEDDFHALGYLLDTDTCEQTEVLDATGLSQQWTTVNLSVPSDGHYRFVFVGGTYDHTWGTAAGGWLYVDAVVLPAVPDPALAAEGVQLAATGASSDAALTGAAALMFGGLLAVTAVRTVRRRAR